MIVAVALLGYAVLLLTVGAVALAGARWTDRAPRLAVAAWLALTGSAVVSVTLGGVALVVPTLRVSADLSVLLTACVMALRAEAATTGSLHTAREDQTANLLPGGQAANGLRLCYKPAGNV